MSSLRFQNVSKVFRIGGYFLGTKLTAVDDFTIHMPSGKPWIMSIVGESGSGKSTLAMMILKLLDCTSGDVFVDDIPISNYSSVREFNKKVQPIFQNPFSTFSMRKKVDTYLFSTAMKCAGAQNRKQAQEIITDVLKSVGLDYDNIAGKYPNQFSGGELQRLSVARALITKPQLIVADEPVAMIDASLKMNIVNLFKELKDKYNVSIIYITHDLSTACYISDYIATLYRGNLIEFGRARDIVENPSHEYTRLLFDSIPKIGQKWDDDMVLPDFEAREYSLSGCKFAPRCPAAKEICNTHKPSMFNITRGSDGDVTHSAQCYKVNDYKTTVLSEPSDTGHIKKI